MHIYFVREVLGARTSAEGGALAFLGRPFGLALEFCPTPAPSIAGSELTAADADTDAVLELLLAPACEAGGAVPGTV